MQLLVITIDKCDEFLHTLEGLRAHGMNGIVDRKSTRLNSSHTQKSRMPSSA